MDGTMNRRAYESEEYNSQRTKFPDSDEDPIKQIEDQIEVLENEDYFYAESKFSDLRRLERDDPRMMDCTYSIAESNMERNRYSSIMTYDFNRVRLFPTLDNMDGYIDASHIYFKYTHQRFIAISAPLPNYINDLWRMVLEQKSPSIIMLANLVESGINKVHLYYPVNENEVLEYDELRITCSKAVNHGSFIHRSLVISSVDKEISGEHRVDHIHYLEWPDFGVPDIVDFHKFFTFLEELKALDRRPAVYTKEPIPLYEILGNECLAPSLAPIIHCSAGVGRTGTFLAIAHLIKNFKTNKRPNYNIQQTVLDMRFQRTEFVQTNEQYTFIHHFVALKMRDIRDEKKNFQEFIASRTKKNKAADCSIEEDNWLEEIEKQQNESDETPLIPFPLDDEISGQFDNFGLS